mmetsp:Transcript_63012/g.138063  ORF Transcript_63012/g.138063 Transcript_63012/m.138063 type:complete len:210 (-) Transcript_63012:296-925(-)
MDLSFFVFFCSALFLASAAAAFTASDGAAFLPAAAFFFFRASKAACFATSSKTFSSPLSPFSSFSFEVFFSSSFALACFAFSSLAASGYPPLVGSPVSASLSFFFLFFLEDDAPPCDSWGRSIPNSPRMASKSSSSGFTGFFASFLFFPPEGAACSFVSAFVPLVSRCSQSCTGAASGASAGSLSVSESEMGALTLRSSSSEASAHLPM